MSGSDNGVLLTVLALGAVLAGGTSAFGRRGGVFGTLLSVTLLVLLVNYGVAADWRMSRVRGGRRGDRRRPAGDPAGRGARPAPLRRRAVVDDVDTWGNVGRTDSAWGAGQRQGGWGSQLPARTIEDTWGGSTDERWGAR